MADFRNKKIRALFDEGGLLREASVEDLALAGNLCKQFLDAGILRAENLLTKGNVTLDPLPAKTVPAVNSPPDGKAED